MASSLFFEKSRISCTWSTTPARHPKQTHKKKRRFSPYLLWQQPNTPPPASQHLSHPPSAKLTLTKFYWGTIW